MASKKMSLWFLTSCFWSIVINYFNKHQPLLRLRISHTYIMLAVTLQLIIAPFMNFDANGDVSSVWYQFIATWLHILNGLGLFAVTMFFSYEVLRRKGICWMYPYLCGKFDEMGKDLKEVMRIRFSVQDVRAAERETKPFIILEQMKLPRPHPSGLGSAVQGIGIVLQLLMVILGVFFLITWAENLDIAWLIIDAHKAVAAAFFIFYVGHGGMGMLHIFNHHAHQRMNRVRADKSGNTTGTESCDLPK